jgi:hypothetical protein
MDSTFRETNLAGGSKIDLFAFDGIPNTSHANLTRIDNENNPFYVLNYHTLRHVCQEQMA